MKTVINPFVPQVLLGEEELTRKNLLSKFIYNLPSKITFRFYAKSS